MTNNSYYYFNPHSLSVRSNKQLYVMTTRSACAYRTCTLKMLKLCFCGYNHYNFQCIAIMKTNEFGILCSGFDIGSKFASTIVFRFPGCPLLTSGGLSSLIQLRQLQELELTNCPGASPELFDYLHEHLPRCVIIEWGTSVVFHNCTFYLWLLTQNSIDPQAIYIYTFVLLLKITIVSDAGCHIRVKFPSAYNRADFKNRKPVSAVTYSSKSWCLGIH